MKRVALLLALLVALPAAADEEMDLDTLLGTFGWDLAAVEIRTEKLSDGIYVLFGLGGNVVVSVGSQGVLIVDDEFPELIPQIEDAIRKLGGNGIDFAINTHWHFDHAQGNLALGPKRTWIVSQANSRAMMGRSNLVNLVKAKYRQEAYPDAAMPVIAFDDRMQFHFNGEQIDLIHHGPAHTTGDAAVVFRGHNVVHMGDVFSNSGYPFIDVDSGGDIDGVIAFCRAILAELQPGATIVPGHGEVTDVAAMKHYVEMLQSVRDRIASLMADGANLEAVTAAKPTAEFDVIYGDVSESMGFIDRVYTSLAKKRS